jgi:hypothetical protein
MKNKLNKMIETLKKFARDGKDTEQTRRLLRNLETISKKNLSNEILESVCKKQSLQSCLDNSVKLLIDIEKLQLNINLSKAPTALKDENFNQEFCGD